MKRFIDKENYFELNAVVDRGGPMQLLEDGGGVMRSLPAECWTYCSLFKVLIKS